MGYELEKRVVVREARYPKFQGGCALCDGVMQRQLIDFPIVRDYDELPGVAIVTLNNVPVLHCTNCRVDWILRRVLKDYEIEVQQTFESILTEQLSA